MPHQISHLNANSHSLIKIKQTYPKGEGFEQGAVMVYPCEICELQKEYPILFRKHGETGRLFPNALLGFEEKENLFIGNNSQWNASYIPLAVQKGPFFITANPSDESGSPVLSIDSKHPSVNESEGEALFDSSANPTRYLDHINQVMARMHHDTPRIKAMVDAFSELDLLEPLNIDIQFENGEAINFSGAYTITREKLSELDGESLLSLNKQGLLSIAFYIADSLNNLSKLIETKNQS